LSFAMFDQLNAALDRAEGEAGGRGIAGRHGRFSGGFDLPVLTALTPHAAEPLRTGFELSPRLHSAPLPAGVAGAGHRSALVGDLVLAGDSRIGAADDDHRITASEVAIGMTLPRAALAICRQRLNPAAFERATLLAEIFTPADAVEAGWLDAVVPSDELRA